MGTSSDPEIARLEIVQRVTSLSSMDCYAIHLNIRILDSSHGGRCTRQQCFAFAVARHLGGFGMAQHVSLSLETSYHAAALGSRCAHTTLPVENMHVTSLTGTGVALCDVKILPASAAESPELLGQC